METQFPVLSSAKPLKPGSEIFQRIPITTDNFKLGRGNRNSVVIPYKCLSKDHCIFRKIKEEWFLENCSYSSIKVNDNKLIKGQKRKLSDQDTIKLDSTNQLVYTFVSSQKNPGARKRQRHNDENMTNDNIKKKLESPSEKRNAKIENDTETILKQQIADEQSAKEKEIYDDYAVRMEKVKGNKNTVKRHKALLKMQRNTRLELLKVNMEEKMASLMAKQNTELPERHSKDLSKPAEQVDQKKSSNYLDKLRVRREQEKERLKERRELKKLRRETRQLKLEKEKKLKELEKQKLRREKELEDQLSKVNKKLAKEIELREKEKKRVEQLLQQKKEDLKKVSPNSGSDKLDMESELQCSICSELFIRATTLGCSHSFCQYCIRRWTVNKRECPICRTPITSECRSIVLDSLVDKMADTEHAKKKRQELVKARDELEAKEPLPAVTRRRRRYLYTPSSDSSHHRDSSLEPDINLLFPMPDSDSDGYRNRSLSDSDDDDDLLSYDRPISSDDDYGEYDEMMENENREDADEEEMEYHEGENNPAEAENSGQDENYEEPESQSENEEEENNSAEDNESNDSPPENYDEEELSSQENEEYAENSAPESEGFEPENEDFEPENEDFEPENEDFEPGNEDFEPENEDFEPENEDFEPGNEDFEPENEEFENSGPENEEFENSGPDNDDEIGSSAPEYDSGPEYDGDSYSNDGNDDYDDYY